MQLSRVFLVVGAMAVALAGGAADARSHTHSYRPHYARAYHSYRSGEYYTNVSGHRVHRPVFSHSAPSGWSAQCRDGSYSFSEHHQGTCSHHGGVSHWR